MSITVAEVKKHRSKNSAWILINNDVYDVTAFLNEHPGGEDSLLEYAGKDGTRAFEDVGHSADARELMKKFKIGSLHPQERKIFVDPCCKAAMSKNSSTTSVPKTPPCQIRSLASCRANSRPVTPKASVRGTPSSITSCGRVHSIVVPRERRPRGYPCGSNKWKWIGLALALAIIAGVAYKRYSSGG